MRVHRVRDPSGVKWSTAVGLVRRLAEQCADVSQLPSRLHLLRVTELWAVGELLGAPRELELATAAVRVDLPVEDVPWMCRPDGADYWVDMKRASKSPVGIWWRSSHAPVWNHRIVRPVLIWDLTAGIREDALVALRDGRGGSIGMAPPSQEEFVPRMDDELRTSLAELRRRTREYESDHTTRVGVRGDLLHAAAQGYLDVLAATTPDASTDATDTTTASQAVPAMKAAAT